VKGYRQGEETVGEIGIVGAGYMAEEHIKALRMTPEARVVGITSRTAARAEQLAARYQIPAVCSSVSELHRQCSPDAVVVAVSELATRAVALECFRFPWVVLLEKPAGFDFADASAIAEAGVRAMGGCYVALNRRFYESTQRVVAELVAEGAARFVFVQDQQDLDEARRAGKAQLVMDNYMYANSIHLIDLFRVFCRGEVEEVRVNLPWVPGRSGAVAASLTFTSGDTGIYVALWNLPGPWSVAVTVPAARWVMAPLEGLGVQRRGSRAVTTVEIPPGPDGVKPGLSAMAGELMKAIVGRSHLLPTLDDALRSTDLVRRIYFPDGGPCGPGSR
jgi:predicted dehydrogenase